MRSAPRWPTDRRGERVRNVPFQSLSETGVGVYVVRSSQTAPSLKPFRP
jgi:hypothetical protein